MKGDFQTLRRWTIRVSYFDTEQVERPYTFVRFDCSRLVLLNRNSTPSIQFHI